MKENRPRLLESFLIGGSVMLTLLLGLIIIGLVMNRTPGNEMELGQVTFVSMKADG